MPSSLRMPQICCCLITQLLAPLNAAPQVAAVAADTITSAAIARFEAEIGAEVERDSIGGITAAVVRGNEVLWVKGFGLADRGAGVPASAATIYRTGSISKTFTAVILLRLVDRGVVQLDDAVAMYLPEFAGLDGPPEQVSSITLRQLASHTAGLVREPRLADAAAGPIEAWDSKVLASIPTTALQSTPGTEYSYSNIGFGILGLTLSRAVGKPFMQLVEELIFEPLGMRSSTFVITGALRDRLSVGYVNLRDGTIDTELPAREHSGRGYKVPNGGVYSTVEDLSLFIAGLTGAAAVQLLSVNSRQEMLTIQTPEDSTQGYGLGLSVQTGVGSSRFVGHGGSVAGYNAYMLFEPESAVGVVLLRNYNGGATNLGRAAAGLMTELLSGQP